jgi:hypothetical protein
MVTASRPSWAANGCGKSNIADAISWVLGEQSAKTLRGSRMEDVIFAGTRDRKPTGMAEVSLTLIDPEVYGGADAHDPTEVEIQDEMPSSLQDWDEAEVRAEAAEETERLTEEARPGKVEEIEGAPAPTPTVAPMTAQTGVATATDSCSGVTNISFVDAFDTPFFSDRVLAGVGGSLNARTTFGASASYVNGVNDQGFQSYRHSSYQARWKQYPACGARFLVSTLMPKTMSRAGTPNSSASSGP